MNEKYDHTKLKEGDPVIYGGYHASHKMFTIVKTRVSRLTATQIVMDNGSRFRRENGLKVGNFGVRLYDSQDPTILNVYGELEAQMFAYGLNAWNTKRQSVRDLQSWEILITEMEGMILDAKQRILEIKGEK